MVFLIPAHSPGFDTYNVVFPFIYLHWMAATENHPSVKLLQDYRLSMSADENEVCDAMIIVLRCFAYQALGVKRVKLSQLLRQSLGSGEKEVEVYLEKMSRNWSYLEHRQETPVNLPYEDTITAYKNAGGAVAWDSRVSLPTSATESVNVFLQSKLRLSGQNLSRAEVDREFGILSKWKESNPDSQMVLVTDAPKIDFDAKKHKGLLFIDKKKLEAYFSKILGKRRDMMSLKEQKPTGRDRLFALFDYSNSANS